MRASRSKGWGWGAGDAVAVLGLPVSVGGGVEIASRKGRSFLFFRQVLWVQIRDYHRVRLMIPASFDIAMTI